MSRSSSDSVSPNNEYDRTILVSGIPEGVTGNKIMIHFQKKKNGGGEVKKVTMLTEGEAMVVFEDPKVANVVVNTEQIFNENVLEVKRLERETFKENAEKSRNKESAGEKEARTVSVSGLPGGATENSVHIHFQKKKNGGGEVEKVKMLGEGKALVVFAEPAVAGRVVNTKQVFMGKDLDVKLQSSETSPTIEKSEEESTEKARTIVVSDLPEGATENSVCIHFQKKKIGGGEVEKVIVLPGNTALVVFEDPEVAKQVVATEQKFKGKIVHVELVETKTYPNAETSGEPEISEYESATILVSGLPEGATENSVHIHFQKKKNGGGEIKKVKLLPGKKKAMVVFEKLEVAGRVVNTKQVFMGKDLDVKLQSSETSPTIEKSEEESTEKARTIVVSDLPEGATENSVCIHFQKKKIGGGEVEKVIVLPGNTALVVFEDPEVARRIVTTPQEMKGKALTINFLNIKESSPEVKSTSEVKRASELKTPPEVTTPEVKAEETTTLESVGSPETERTPEAELKPEERRKMEERATAAEISLEAIDPVFSMVTATVNPMLMNTGSQYFRSDVFNIIQRNCGVQCQVSAYGVLLTGSLNQVTRAGELLELQWRKHCQDLQLRNIDHHNLFNQGDPNFYRGDTSFNQSATNFNQGDTNFNQGGTNFNQGGTNFNQGDKSINQSGTTLNQAGTNVNQSSTYFNQSGMNFNQSGTHFTERGTALNQHAPTFNQHSMTNSIGSSFGRQEFVSSGHSFDARSESQYYQQNVNYFLHQGNQQSGRNREEQWPNETGPGSANSYTRELGPHFSHRDMRNFNQPPDAKQPGFVETTANHQPFGNLPNIPPEYIARSPRAGETDPRGAELPRSVDSTRNPQPFGNSPNTHPEYTARSLCAGETDPRSAEPPRSADNTRFSQPFYNPSNHPPPGYIDKSLNSTIMQGDQAIGGTTDPPCAKSAASQDSTKPPQPLRHDENGTSTDSTTESITPKVDGTFPPGKTKVTAMPESYLEGTTIPQPPVNNQQSITPNSSTGPKSSTTSSNQFGSPSNNKTDPRSEKPPISPRSTTNHQTPVKNQQSTSPNPLTGPESLTTPSNPFESPSNDKTDSQRERPLTLPKSTTNRQLPVNHQESTTLNIATGAESLTNSSNPLGLRTSSEKPPGLPESTTNPQPTGSDQRATMTEPNTGPQNLNNSTNQTGTHSNEKPNSLTGKQPDSSDHAIKPQPLDNGQLQQGTTSNTTTESQNSTTTDNQVGVSLTSTPGSLTGKPYNPVEKAPNNRPQHNQQQTTPNQQASAPDITNTETADKSPVSKLGEKPHSSTDPNNKPQKRTPIPLPRQNILGTSERRQNAANFSSPVKATQARQGSPAPTEPNNSSVNDATNPNKKGDQNATTLNEVNDSMLDELD